MTMIPNTVVEYSEYAAREYLQTVVFIDDRIYDRKTGSAPTGAVSSPKRRKPATRSAAQTSMREADAQAPEPDAEEYSPHDIVTSFAKRQIICALYQPQRNAKVSRSSDIFPLCLAADIVIVDWDLYGDKGTKAIELVVGLIEQATTDVPEQLRVFLVYTQEANLFDIANALFTKMAESLQADLSPSKDEGGLAWHTANIRVSVLGKIGRGRLPEYKDHEVEERDLADRAITEFARLASGILHATSLLGLAEIKKNSRKILSKFHSSLDPAFLTHRAMALKSEDASDHIVPLLVAEIEAVLEDSLPNPLITEKVIEDWCRNVWVPGGHTKELLAGDQLDVRSIGTAFCLQGEKARERHNAIPKLTSNGNIRKVAKLLLDSETSKANHELSHLMSCRTFYRDVPKSLKLGCIVYNGTIKEYLLCLQPVCDSVRLQGVSRFVFAYLKKTEENEKNRTTHVVAKTDGEMLELFYQPGASSCYVTEFLPDTHSRQVRTKKGEGGSEHFVDRSDMRYLWIDQLKPAQAQRAVEQFARELSRVGLTESEWLRRIER